MTSPVSDQLGIPVIIQGLCNDLDQLRSGEICVNDAIARSLIAKQIFNGIRLYMNGMKLMSDNAKSVTAISAPKEVNEAKP